MSQSFDIAVIGATGTVGETLVQILEERDFPVGNLHLLASSESAGHSVPFRGKNVGCGKSMSSTSAKSSWCSSPPARP
jgi:aspartate-semialdehyde dehydrogenase